MSNNKSPAGRGWLDYMPQIIVAGCCRVVAHRECSESSQGRKRSLPGHPENLSNHLQSPLVDWDVSKSGYNRSSSPAGVMRSRPSTGTLRPIRRDTRGTVREREREKIESIIMSIEGDFGVAGVIRFSSVTQCPFLASKYLERFLLMGVSLLRSLSSVRPRPGSAWSKVGC